MPEQKSLPPPHLLALQILGQRPPGFPAEHACMRIKACCILHSEEWQRSAAAALTALPALQARVLVLHVSHLRACN